MAAPMKPSEALRKARELITPTGKWIQGEIALASNGGDLCRGDDPGAVCWCSLGAIEHEAGCGTDVDRAAWRQLEKTVGMDVSEWNDDLDRTHAEVLDAFDRAAALAEAEGR